MFDHNINWWHVSTNSSFAGGLYDLSRTDPWSIGPDRNLAVDPVDRAYQAVDVVAASVALRPSR